MSGEGKSRKKYLSITLAITAIVLPFPLTYLIGFPFLNANYIINTGELLMGFYSLLHIDQFFNYWWGPFLLYYFQQSADYYYLLLGWSMKEKALVDTLEILIPAFIGITIATWCCIWGAFSIFLKD